MITQEQLKELFDYNSFNLIWKVKRQGCNIGDVAGFIRSDGYRRITIFGKKYLAHRLIWIYVYGYYPHKFIDHINRIKDDNRICNLREATNSQNKCNTDKQSNNTSGYKGVCWNKERGKWWASITLNGKRTHLGYFADIDTAAKVREDASIKYFGEFVGST
jgi:hypothetical protein